MNGASGSTSPWRLTPAVKLLLLANFGIYITELLVTNWAGSRFFVDHLFLVPGKVVSFPVPKVWQLFTYMWLHDPVFPTHILMNMLGLWMFGGLLEMRWGTRSFVRFYVLCGLVAAVGIVVAGLISSPDTPIVGASGAIFGLLVAFGLLYGDMQVYLMFMIPMRGKTLVWIFVGIEILTLLARVDLLSAVAHLSGAAGGYLLVTGYWRPSKLRVRFGLPTRGPRRPPPRKKADYLKVVPREEEEEKGTNGAGKYLH